MKKYLWILILIFTFSQVSFVYADGSATSGLISGQIWYSKDPLVEGDTVRVYTAVLNGDVNPLQARVEFYDQSVILGTRDITVPSQTLDDVFVSWQVTSGDHLISAKILSSSIQSGSKTQSVSLEHNSTNADHTFVPVAVKAKDGTVISGDTIVKAELNKMSSQLASAVPQSVSGTVTSVDSVRVSISDQIEKSKEDTKEKIATLNGTSNSKTTTPTSKPKTATSVTTKSDSTSAIQKPIMYIKLFLLTLASFIFKYKIVFYGLIVLIVFIICRFLYSKIKHK
jgi:hypothetical protein